MTIIISRERRSKDREDGVPPMPKATDHQAPVSNNVNLFKNNTKIKFIEFLLQNFVASNKYSMLHEDTDTDNIDD